MQGKKAIQGVLLSFFVSCLGVAYASWTVFAEALTIPWRLAQPVRVTIAFPTQGASMLPLWLAKDAGLFTKYGLDAQLVYIGGSARLTEAVAGGGVDFGLVTADPVGKAKVAGHDLVMLAAIAERVALYVYGQKGMTPDGLRGRALITAPEGTTYDHLAREFLRRHGLTPGKDVRLIHMAGEGDRTAAFLRGEAAAYVVAPPTSLRIEAMGYPKLFDFKDVEILLAAIGTKRDYYRRHPEIARAVVAAVAEATSLILTGRAKQKAVEVIKNWTGIDDDTVAEATYSVHVPTFPRKPYITDSAVRFVLDNSTDERVRKMGVSELVDNSIVRELDESGWLDSLYP